MFVLVMRPISGKASNKLHKVDSLLFITSLIKCLKIQTSPIANENNYSLLAKNP